MPRLPEVLVMELSRTGQMMETTMDLTKAARALSWLLQLIAAAILLQTLYFKFTGAEESVYIFTTLGMEPWGRIGTGVFELIASILLLVPSTVTIGAIFGVGLMAGAIMGHLTKLGISVMGDGGELFFLAVIVLVCCLAVLWLRRRQIPIIGGNF